MAPKTNIIPVIVGAMGMIKKGTNKYNNKVPSKTINTNSCPVKCRSAKERTVNVTKKGNRQESKKIVIHLYDIFILI